MTHTFYVLFSAARNKFYIGFTSDSLAERLRKHNSHHKGFTGGAGDWTVVYTEVFPSAKEAIQREKQVKRWKSRKMIEQLRLGLAT